MRALMCYNLSILLTCNLFLSNASPYIPVSQYSNFIFNTFIVVICFQARESSNKDCCFVVVVPIYLSANLLKPPVIE